MQFCPLQAPAGPRSPPPAGNPGGVGGWVPAKRPASPPHGNNADGFAGRGGSYVGPAETRAAKGLSCKYPTKIRDQKRFADPGIAGAPVALSVFINGPICFIGDVLFAANGIGDKLETVDPLPEWRF